MAIDESLLQTAEVPILRFYRWNEPSVSFGYFGRFEEARRSAGSRTLVRRWTGGGIVFHGDDLTYSIVIPASDPVSAEAPMSIYEKVHCALRDALISLKQHAVLASGVERGAAVSDRGYNGHCFANPVCADIIVNGRKIAGAAQRRTRWGLLQQGSIQNVDRGKQLAQRFARELSAIRNERTLSEHILERAQKLSERKYANQAWLRIR
jgi:lipoyl(octanoyl) transferase